MLTEASLIPSEGVRFARSTVSAEVVMDKPRSHEHTTSVNRSYSDLNGGSFLLYSFGLCAARTALQQPMNLALARKQTSSVYGAMSSRQILSRVYRHEGGLRGWGQGMAAMTLGCALSEVIYLFLFEYWRERLPFRGEAARDAAAGYGADAMCRCVHIPLTVIAFRQMIAATTTTSPTPVTKSSSTAVSRAWGPRSSVAAKSAWGTLGAMYRENGMRTVFAGYGTTLAVGCQWSALWWALYGSFKGSLYAAAAPLLLADAGSVAEDHAARRSSHGGTTHASSSSCSSSGHTTEGASGRATLLRVLPAWCVARDDNLIINSLASVAAGASTAVIFNPYLVVRTNLQTIPMATLRSVTAHVYATRGIRGFYGGLWLNVSTCIIDGMLASTSYEYAKLWADKSRHAHHYSSSSGSSSSSSSPSECCAADEIAVGMAFA